MLSLHLPVSGASTGSKHGPSQHPQTESNPWQASALTATIKTSVANDSQIPSLIEVIIPWVSQSSSFNQDLTQWEQLLAKRPIARGPRIADGAGNSSSANWTIPLPQDTFKDVRKRWINRILSNHFHSCFVHECLNNQTTTFITDEERLPFLQDLQSSFSSIHSLGHLNPGFPTFSFEALPHIAIPSQRP